MFLRKVCEFVLGCQPTILETPFSLYIHVTVHRNRFLSKYPTRRNNYPNLFCYKTLHVSGIFSAHHQEFSTVQSALVSFMQVSDDRFQAELGWNCASILTLLESGHQKPA
jgi:hypothetical protein